MFASSKPDLDQYLKIITTLSEHDLPVYVKTVGFQYNFSMSNVLFEVLYNEFLFFNNEFDNVTNRDQTDQLIVLHNRKVTNFFVRHNFHAVFDTRIWSNGDRMFCHDFANECFF